ncbi:MAG: hypothetical protein ABR953_05160 [Candidatus Acidiferrales bacterium]|jgi:hypothetical protein
MSRVSFNGGHGGIMAQPTAEDRLAERDHHIGPTSMQTQHEHSASTNRAFLASENRGRPAIAATSKAGDFNRGVVASRGTTNFHPPTNSGSATHGGTNNSTTHTNNPNYSRNNTNAANATHGGNSNFNPPHNQSNTSHGGASGGGNTNQHVSQPHNESHPSNPPKNEQDDKHH